MLVRSVVSSVLGAAAFSLFLAIGATGAGAYDCESQVSEQLQQLGVAESDVASVRLMRQSPGKSPSSYTYNAWVRLKSCSKGAVVVRMTKQCLVQDVYTTGDCRVSEASTY